MERGKKEKERKAHQHQIEPPTATRPPPTGRGHIGAFNDTVE